jgi:hypothetical protein
METLFLAIISVCISTTNCSNGNNYEKYISEPFAVESAVLKHDTSFMPICSMHIDALKVTLTKEQKTRTMSALCVRKDVWDKTHPE